MTVSKGIKWGIGILAFLGLAMLVVSFFISGVVEKRIIKALSRDFEVSIQDTDVNVWNTSASFGNVSISGYYRNGDSIHVELKSLTVNFSSLYNVFWADTLAISSVNLNYPNLRVYNLNTDTTKSGNKKFSYKYKPLKIKQLELTNGKISFFSKGDTLQTSSKNFQVFLNQIDLNRKTSEAKVPFTFNLQSVRISQFYQRMNGWEDLYVRDIEVHPEKIEASGIRIKPKYSQKTYIKYIPYQNDWIDLTVENVTIKQYELNLADSLPHFKTPSVVIDSAALHLYRDKAVARNLSGKPLYNKMLRELSAAIEVDSVQIHKSAIIYEEKLPERPYAGMIDFTNMEVLITDINNVDTDKKTQIAIDCRFLKQAPLHIDWMFDIHHPKDYFEISGTMGSVEIDELNNFVEPNMNVNVSGSVTTLMFNFYGNNNRAKGVFTMKYEDLKVDLFNKKNPKKKSKILSALANLFIGNKKKKFEQQQVEVERVQYKSFFNYFWLCVQDGVKKTVL